MIKEYWCHNGRCPSQLRCKTVVSSNDNTVELIGNPIMCHVVGDSRSIWKDVPLTPPDGAEEKHDCGFEIVQVVMRKEDAKLYREITDKFFDKWKELLGRCNNG